MPAHRIGVVPMTSAERQARHRAKLRRPSQATPRAPASRLPPRPKRWAAAVATLVALQDEYRAWLDRLPESLEGSPTAEKLQAITEIDLDELQAIDPRAATAATDTTRSPNDTTMAKLLNLTDTTVFCCERQVLQI